jgi:predicted RNA binding protein YcfA (HicA-like mRNA interferase family)
MPGLPRVTGIDMVRALNRAGWYEVSQVGSHKGLKHSTKPGKVTVPVHRGETLPARTVSSILKQAGMTADELRALL